MRSRHAETSSLVVGTLARYGCMGPSVSAYTQRAANGSSMARAYFLALFGSVFNSYLGFYTGSWQIDVQVRNNWLS